MTLTDCSLLYSVSLLWVLFHSILKTLLDYTEKEKGYSRQEHLCNNFNFKFNTRDRGTTGYFNEYSIFVAFDHSRQFTFIYSERICHWFTKNSIWQIYFDDTTECPRNNKRFFFFCDFNYCLFLHFIDTEQIYNSLLIFLLK